MTKVEKITLRAETTVHKTTLFRQKSNISVKMFRYPLKISFLLLLLATIIYLCKIISAIW